MISSKLKNNIYALISISLILLTIISFVLITQFMVRVNDLVFDIGESENDNSVLLNVSGYDKIKIILDSKLNS